MISSIVIVLIDSKKFYASFQIQLIRNYLDWVSWLVRLYLIGLYHSYSIELTNL